jgi:hypothetical protein
MAPFDGLDDKTLIHVLAWVHEVHDHKDPD